MSATVFLIGATGHVGVALMAELLPDHQAGHLSVKVGVHSERSRALVNAQGLQAVSFDLNRIETFDPALQGFDLLDGQVELLVAFAIETGWPIYIRTGTPPHSLPLQVAWLASRFTTTSGRT